MAKLEAEAGADFKAALGEAEAIREAREARDKAREAMAEAEAELEAEAEAGARPRAVGEAERGACRLR